MARCRLQVVGDAKGETMRRFLHDHVELGSVIISDGFASYPWACGMGYDHRPRKIADSGWQAHDLLPGVHRVASLAKRWLLATHQAG